jgi:hypothetical protein
MLRHPFIALNSKAVERGFPVSNIGVNRIRFNYCAVRQEQNPDKLQETRTK